VKPENISIISSDTYKNYLDNLKAHGDSVTEFQLFTESQFDTTQFATFSRILKAIEESDRVDFFWLDGCPELDFVLGMTFALYKPMKLVTSFTEDFKGKSFLIQTCEKLTKLSQEKCKQQL
jgi:hypothetical protein